MSLAKIGTKYPHGRNAWNKGKTGEKMANWKGNKVGYFALHSWIIRQLGKAKECSYCGKEDWEGRIEWANIDHQYKRILDDYIPLCASCHRIYDRIADNRMRDQIGRFI